MTIKSSTISTAAAALLLAGATAAAGVVLAPAASGAPGAAATAVRTAAAPHHTAAVPLPNGFRPEGIASFGRTFFSGSLADGRIWRGDLLTGRGAVLVPGVPGRSLRGMQVDRRTGLLWVTGNDGTIGIVLAVDARTGQVVRRVEVPGAVFLNDLVVTRATVWVTDSRVDRLTAVPLTRSGRPKDAPVRFLPLTGDWPTPAGVRANGIRELRDGTLVLDNSTAGGLYAVDPRSGEVARIPVTGTPAVVSGDGLELVGNRLYVVRGTGGSDVTVVRLRPSRDGWTGAVQGVLTDPRLDVPSTATVALGRLWAVNARFGVANPATASYSVVPLPLTPR
jgi:outer membrane protein assembly factor BamB